VWLFFSKFPQSCNISQCVEKLIKWMKICRKVA
jgi:hypothetical protein